MAKASLSKLQALRETGTLNPHPEKVTDPLFQEEEFLDPHDLVQVKYEMLRRAQKEGTSILSAASAFGFSRPAFYQAQKLFEQEGLAGLLPQRRGPKQAHKLTGEVMEAVQQALAQDPALRAPALARLVKERFGLSVHPRSIERALSRQEKKLPG